MGTSNNHKPNSIQPKRKAGRPSEYTPEKALAVCQAYANGMSIEDMDKDPSLPHHNTWQRWEGKHDDFAQALARARDHKGEWAAEKGRTALDITDDELIRLDKAASAAVQVRKSRSEYYRWLAGKLSPRFADRTEVHLSGSVDMRGTLGGPLIGQAQVIDARPAELPEGDDQG